MTQRRGLDCALVTDGAASAWLQIDSVLWLVGSIAWLVGLAEQWRLRRRFEEKTGEDLYGLEELADRYLQRPWLWLRQAPSVLKRMLPGGTTPIADAELAATRSRANRRGTPGGQWLVHALPWVLLAL